MNNYDQPIRTIENAVDRLKHLVFERLEKNENSLADIETIARVINSIAVTQEHLALTRQTERFERAAENIRLAPGATIPLGGTSDDAPPIELKTGMELTP